MTERVMSAEEQKRRGEVVERFLKDEAVSDALLAVRDNVVRRWHAAKDTAAREAEWYKLHALEEIVNELRVVVGRADFVKAQSERRQ